jgi:hypothetical protein
MQNPPPRITGGLNKQNGFSKLMSQRLSTNKGSSNYFDKRSGLILDQAR